jgi:hypothetical protein
MQGERLIARMVLVFAHGRFVRNEAQLWPALADCRKEQSSWL